MKVILFNVWFYTLFLVYTLLITPLLTAFVVLSRLLFGRRRAMYVFRQVIKAYGKGIIKVLTFPCIRVRYRDLSAEGEPAGPCVFVCNHRSSSDPFLLAFLPGEIVQVVNTWPFRLPLLGIMARFAGYLSVKEMPFEEFAAKSSDYLNQGVSIAAFPEGTRSGGRTVGQFHGAIFRVCLETHVPIVPVCIVGNEDKPPRGSLLMRPGRVRVHRLPALCWEHYRELTPFKLKNTVRDMLRAHISGVEVEENDGTQPQNGNCVRVA